MRQHWKGYVLGGLIGALPGIFFLSTVDLIVDNEATQGGGLFFGVMGLVALPVGVILGARIGGGRERTSLAQLVGVVTGILLGGAVSIGVAQIESLNELWMIPFGLIIGGGLMGGWVGSRFGHSTTPPAAPPVH